MYFLERQVMTALIVSQNYPNIKLFRRRIGHWPRILFPQTYNEKMLWRKLFDHSPVIARLTDKLLAKKYFAELCPDLNVVTPLWVGTRAEDIPDALLEQDVIVKTNHGCAYNIIMRDTDYDRDTLNKTVNDWLDTVYGAISLQWAYSQITPKVFVEPMLRPTTGQTPYEFDFEVCNGRITTCFVMGSKASGSPKIGIFDASGNRLPVTVKSVPNPEDQLPQDTVLPTIYQQAARYAERLGRDHDNVRVDFMCVNDEIYGCEMTFYSMSGRGNLFSDATLYQELSSAWDLRRSWFLNTNHTGWRGRYAATLNARLARTQAHHSKKVPQ